MLESSESDIVVEIRESLKPRIKLLTNKNEWNFLS